MHVLQVNPNIKGHLADRFETVIWYGARRRAVEHFTKDMSRSEALRTARQLLARIPESPMWSVGEVCGFDFDQSPKS